MAQVQVSNEKLFDDFRVALRLQGELEAEDIEAAVKSIVEQDSVYHVSGRIGSPINALQSAPVEFFIEARDEKVGKEHKFHGIAESSVPVGPAVPFTGKLATVNPQELFHHEVRFEFKAGGRHLNVKYFNGKKLLGHIHAHLNPPVNASASGEGHGHWE